MYRNLLVHIPTERSARPAVDGAVSLAMSCGAHLDAIAAGFESTHAMPLVAEGGAAVASILDFEHERALERAHTALAIFEVEAKAAEISYGSRPIAGSFAEVVSKVGAAARLYDLTVVSQGEPGRDSFDNQLPEILLLQTGGPCLFFPHTFRGAFKAARIGICWDGSRLAARALRDARPLLAAADVLTVLTLNPSQVPADAAPAQLARHMARDGLPVRTISLEAARNDEQSSILSVAADESFDLLVMGGYGHSRMQETVFGGVTREMFRSMTVPVLMSH
jgi:nucleotide-binding universal stress UspA family protein